MSSSFKYQISEFWLILIINYLFLFSNHSVNKWASILVAWYIATGLNFLFRISFVCLFLCFCLFVCFVLFLFFHSFLLIHGNKLMHKSFFQKWVHKSTMKRGPTEEVQLCVEHYRTTHFSWILAKETICNTDGYIWSICKILIQHMV